MSENEEALKTSLNEHRLRVKRITDFLKLSGGMSALLIGEHEGILASTLEEAFGCSVIWFEPMENFNGARTSDMADTVAIKRPKGNPHRMPFDSECFDRLASQFTLNYLRDPISALTDWCRVLKKDGIAAFVTLNSAFTGWHQRPLSRIRWTYSKEKLFAMLRCSGFSPIESTSLIPNLRLPMLYRGDLSFCLKLERLPIFRESGKILIVSAIKR